MNQPWDPQQGETHRAYQAFSVYRDLGPERSISRVASELAPTRGARHTQLEKWSGTHNWRSRALAWDAEQDRHRRRRTIKARSEMLDELRSVTKAMQNGISLPTRAIMYRLVRDPEDTVRQLAEEMTIPQLLALQAMCARALPGIVELHLMTLGGQDTGEEVDPALPMNPVEAERELRDIARLMHDHKLLPSGD